MQALLAACSLSRVGPECVQNDISPRHFSLCGYLCHASEECKAHIPGQAAEVKSGLIMLRSVVRFHLAPPVLPRTFIAEADGRSEHCTTSAPQKPLGASDSPVGATVPRGREAAHPECVDYGPTCAVRERGYC